MIILKAKKIVSVLSMSFIVLLLASCGGGGGSGSGSDGGTETGISYTGPTSQAVIDENNAEGIAVGAYENGRAGTVMSSASAVQAGAGGSGGRPRALAVFKVLDDSLRQANLSSRSGGTLSGAIYTQSDTINGECGGSASYSISINDETAKFSGSIIYTSFCNGGVIITGDVEFSGTLDKNTDEFLTLSFFFEDLTCTACDDSFTLNGEISCKVSDSTKTLIMTMYLEDNSTGKVYWAKDQTVILFEGSGYAEIEISGRYYDPGYGYVVLSTEVPMIIYEGDNQPSEGVLVLTGKPGSAGGATRAQLTFLSSMTYQVEADTNGDGSYDWDSGVRYWENGELGTEIDWVFTQKIMTREYSGGVLAIVTFFRKFAVSGNSGNIQITGTLKDAPESADAIDEHTEIFYVEGGKQYEISVRVKVGGEKLCNPFATDVMIFSSPSASTTKETIISPVPHTDNNFYCITAYVIDSITLEQIP